MTSDQEAEDIRDGADALVERHAGFRRALTVWLEEHPGGHVYALLDRACTTGVADHLHPGQLAERPTGRHRQPVPRADLPNDPEAWPELVQLFVAGEHGWADEQLLDLTFISALERCRSMDGASVAGWLLSDADPPRLARHLSGAGVLFDPLQARERHVALFEPHRLALFAAQAAPAALHRWLGPVDCWLFVDGNGDLRRLDRPHASTGADAAGAARLTRRQAAAQSRVPAARRVLLALERLDLPLASPELRIDAALARAWDVGLRHAEDLVCFALNDLTVGPHWSSHPRAAALIERVASDPQLGLAAELTRLPDEVLDTFGGGAAAAGGPPHAAF